MPIEGYCVCPVCKEIRDFADCKMCINCGEQFCEDICAKKVETKDSEKCKCHCAYPNYKNNYGECLCGFTPEYQMSECIYCTLNLDKLTVTTEEFYKYLERDANQFYILFNQVKKIKYQELIDKQRGTGAFTKPAISNE